MEKSANKGLKWVIIIGSVVVVLVFVLGLFWMGGGDGRLG